MGEICTTCGQEIKYNTATFAGRLGSAMSESNVTRESLAKALGYKSTAQVTRWLTGHAQPHTVADIERIGEVVKQHPSWLLYGHPQPSLPLETPTTTTATVDPVTFGS